MIVRLYRKPERVGWRGWLESTIGLVLGFIHLDGTIVWTPEVAERQAIEFATLGRVL
jgi:hypothetical protein